MPQISLEQQVKNITGSVTFDRMDSRSNSPLTYIYLQAKLGVSILKVQGELPPVATPRTRGAQQWAQRRAGRQATLFEGGNRLFLEEAGT